MAEDNNWCGIDLENLCLAEDAAKLLQADMAVTQPRQITAASSDKEADIEEGTSKSSPKPKSRGFFSSNKHSDEKKTEDLHRKGSTGDDSHHNKASVADLEALPPPPPPKKETSFMPSLPFNLSFSGNNKTKEKEETTKVEAKKEAITDDESEAPYTGRDIQANVFMISGCEDSQTSADVSNVSDFSLPDPNGKAGGACTSAMLKVLYASGRETNTNLTFIQVLTKMRKVLRNGRYSQIPQLTSSQPMDVDQTFYIVPPDCQGTKRAVLIGINYTGQNGQLSGCHNDCLNMKDYIMNVWGFEEENIEVLMDDGHYTNPSRYNILQAYKNVAAASKSGDAVFCHYSGHGGRVRDDDWGEEADGFDETLVPVDYSSAGQIRDDDLYTQLVCAMPGGSTLVSLMDCCHSATVLDLPYKYRASGQQGGTSLNPLSLDGGNALITAFLCAVIVVILVVMLPIMFT